MCTEIHAKYYMTSPPWLFKHIIVYIKAYVHCALQFQHFHEVSGVHTSEILDIVNEAPKSPMYEGIK